MNPQKGASPLVVGLVGVIFVLLGVLGFTLGRPKTPEPTPAPGPTPAASTPAPTKAPQETPTPRPTATPESEPGEIIFGTGVEKMRVRGERESFSPDDAFAFVATSPERFGTTELEATLALKNSDGGERPLRRWSIEISGPENNQFSQSQSRAEDFMGGESEPGRYILRLIRGGKTLCKGEFTLTKVRETPKPQEETPEPQEPGEQDDGRRHYHSSDLGVRLSAPPDWTISDGSEGDESFVSIRKSETPPISMRLLRNPKRDFNAQEALKRKTFGRRYKKIGRNSGRSFHGIPAETWAFLEPSDSGALKKILKFRFEKNDSPWEFAIIAPASEFESYRSIFHEIIDSIKFD